MPTYRYIFLVSTAVLFSSSNVQAFELPRSGNATTVHRSQMLPLNALPPASSVGSNPSATESEQNATTVHAPETIRNPLQPLASRIGTSPSAPDGQHDATTVHPRR